MLLPKKVKYRRWQKMRVNQGKLQNRVSTRGTKVSFGDFGMKVLEAGNIRSNQIEAARRVISRSTGKVGKTWIRIFPDRPVTKKAAEVPMGKGKGDLNCYEFRVLPGRIIFEVAGVSEKLAHEAITKAGKKLPVRIKMVQRIAG